MPPLPRRATFSMLRWFMFSLCLTAALGCSLALVSCSSLQRTLVEPPVVPGATFLGNAGCVNCHSNYTRTFAAAPHARVRIEGVKSDAGCEACHGPGSLHAKSPHSAEKLIVNPRKEPAACLTCHLQTQAEFHLPQHHPLIEGKMNCVQCHDPHGMDIRKKAGGLALARRNEGCAECHREQSRPFIYEHEAMREGCTSCHNPHGSVNPKLLTARDNNLCLRCHAQVQGSGVPGGGVFIGKVDHSGFSDINRLRQGGCWAAGCHAAVHGSNVSPRMFY